MGVNPQSPNFKVDILTIMWMTEAEVQRQHNSMPGFSSPYTPAL